jgi:mycothiol synthase
MTMEGSRLLMTRRHLKAIGKLSLPKGYALRTYQPGDDAHWARIIASAFQTECSASVFQKEIAQNAAFRAERVLFLTYGNMPIGTATAWLKEEFGSGAGYVHMVAIIPEHTRKGLGKALTAAVLRHFQRHGLRAAFLHTEGSRLAAIKTYLELGFEPVIEDQRGRSTWQDVFRVLGRPDLAHRFCGQE